MKRINGGTLQDLHHYALAMQGNTASTFPCETLWQRLDAAESAYYLLSNLDEAENCKLWERFVKEPGAFKSDHELAEHGRDLHKLVLKVGALLQIDTRSGERNTR